MNNTYGDAIPDTFVIAHAYAWAVDGDGYMTVAPANANGTVDWDNMGEPCDMTEMTTADVNRIVHDLGLDAWPKMSVMPGEFERP